MCKCRDVKPPGDFQSEVGSQPEVSPIEKARAQQVNWEFQAIFNDADMAASDHFTTPRSPGKSYYLNFAAHII